MFLRAYDKDLFDMCETVVDTVVVTDGNQIEVIEGRVCLPQSLFDNAVTEHIIYQLLVALQTQGKISQNRIDEFVENTRIAPFVWELGVAR